MDLDTTVALMAASLYEQRPGQTEVRAMQDAIRKARILWTLAIAPDSAP